MIRTLFATAAATVAIGALTLAQGERPMSPSGTAEAQVHGHWVKPAGRGAPTLGGETYQDGKWITITYGRPLKRGRDLFGSGATYGKAALVGSPIWRAGANVSTRLKTEVPLVINGTTVAPGEYSLFIDLKENHWTLVVSNWAAQTVYDPINGPSNREALWGSYGYTSAKDVVRAPMVLEALPHVHEQLSWEFLDVTDAGGSLAITWDKTLATCPFRVGI
jgi:hypothetical protein